MTRSSYVTPGTLRQIPLILFLGIQWEHRTFRKYPRSASRHTEPSIGRKWILCYCLFSMCVLKITCRLLNIFLRGLMFATYEFKETTILQLSHTVYSYTWNFLFFPGSVWVYKEYEPNYDPSRGKYCNQTLYLFAFWLITSVYIVLGVIIMCLCSISVASIAFQRDT